MWSYSYMRCDNVKRRGRSVIAIPKSKLYVMSLDATALHYLHSEVSEFQALAVSASIQ